MKSDMKRCAPVVWLALLSAITCAACAAQGGAQSRPQKSDQASAQATPQRSAERVAQPGASVQTSARTDVQAAALSPGTHAIAGAASNLAVEQRVDSFEVAASFEGSSAPPGHAFVVLNVHWKNILPSQEVSDADQPADPTLNAGGLGSGGSASKKSGTAKTHTVFVPYLIPDGNEHLRLIVNGEAGATLVNDRFKGKDLLPAGAQKIVHGVDVAGRYVFDAPAPVASLELDYFDTNYGNIRISIAGTAPSAPRGVIAGPLTSGALVSSVTDVQEVAAVGEHKARAGARFVVVSILGQGAASLGDNFLEVKPVEIARLMENTGYVYAPTEVDDLDGAWSGTVRFVPGAPSRGKLVFEVPAQHGPLALSVMVPGEARPMRLRLSPAAAAAPSKPTAMGTVADGATGTFYLYGARRARTLGEEQAGAGEEFLVLDVGIENRTDSGLDFQTKEQIQLLNGDETIAATDEDLAAAPRALAEDGVVPAHTLGRYEIPFRVPAGASKLAVFYRGFENEKKVPLPLGGVR